MCLIPRIVSVPKQILQYHNKDNGYWDKKAECFECQELKRNQHLPTPVDSSFTLRFYGQQSFFLQT